MIPPHGTCNRYTHHGCRCTECRAAHAANQKARRRAKAYGRLEPGFLDATGTKRRLEALMTLGWSKARLGRRLGLHSTTLHAIWEGQYVTPRQHERICRLYDELWDKPAPARDLSEKCSVGHALAEARRNGYAPPMAWDDDEIDNPAAKPYVARRAA